MATIGQLGLELTKHTHWLVTKQSLERWATQRAKELTEAIYEHEDSPTYLFDTDRAVRVLVSLHTGLQPSEFDKLTAGERVPFLERTAERLGIDTNNFGDEDSEQNGDTVAVKRRFQSPPCEKCGEKSGVASTQGKTRYLKCTNEDCGHTWKKVSIT